ncbi:MAG: PIG-L family deacetylase [Acidobacteria bacterium]|nr:PIG-L family deacetylase [Acidobacteriota bacterium]
MKTKTVAFGSWIELGQIRNLTGAARRLGAGLLAGVLLALLWVRTPAAPVSAAAPNDIAAVADAIERLPVVGSVLLTGAHPDDENNALLAYLARGLHLRIAYLSATRGDGGQNLLGNEQYEALGILRTEELLAARRLDGAEQFFAQAYDFGFSKSAEETLQKWGHENVVGDYVRVIREYRPDIVISRFTGTAADGHGHHHASGILTKEAFSAAADPNRFPELAKEGLTAWQAKWLFINRGGGGGGRPAGPDSFTITLGGFNPLYGEVLGDLGAQARSQHRSQGMGQSGRGGTYTASFSFWDSAQPGATAPKGLFDGIDLTLNRFTILAGGAPGVAQRVTAIEKVIAEVRTSLSPTNPAKALPMLVQGLSLLRELPAEISSSNAPQESKDLALFWLEKKESDFERAIGLAGGVGLDALADSGVVVPGGTFQVTVTGVVREASGLQGREISLTGPAGWKFAKTSPSGGPSGPGESVVAMFQVTVPPDAPLSQPYWLVNSRTNDSFRVEPGPIAGTPHQPALLKAHFQLHLANAGQQIELEQDEDVVYRFTDRIYGERQSPLAVLPQLGVWLEPGVAVFPHGATTTRAFLARVRNNTASEQNGTLRLALPAGWQSSPHSAPFSLSARDDEASIRFEVTPPASASTATAERLPIKAIAEAGGTTYSTGYMLIDYPHIQTRYWFQPPASNLERFNVKVAPGLQVGYIMGSGDEVPNGLKQLGVEVTELTADDLAYGDLKRFNVIVTGIRAYEVRRDISVNHARLMDFVNEGGVMIAQYSRPGGFSDILSPYPMKMDSGLRVAVEEAPVEILEPANPLFHFPNEITLKDFDGWVQERGTYFMATWAPEFTPLLESHDPGEPPQRGGMLLAPYGKGWYLYTGYVWFRQLPAGVPGAYRIFANMISLAKSAQESR